MAEPPQAAEPYLLRFHGTLPGLERGGEALRQLLDEQHVEGAPRYRVELAFDEIAGNIVRHGKPVADIEVAVSFAAGAIALSFEDDGPPFDPRCDQEASLAATMDGRLGGLGLPLVASIATHLFYERTGDQRNHLTLTIPAS